MRFSFNIKLTDEDYYLFNEFAARKSPIGKKSALISKMLVAVIFLLGAVSIFIIGGINPASVVASVFFVILYAIFLLTFNKSNSKLVKHQAKLLLKKEKKPYTPDSVLEFYDDFFKEICPDNKSEISYTAIDKIYVVMNHYVFIFIDSMRGYIVPFDCFKDEAEEKEFLVFLSSLSENVEFFEKI